ncbi:MAG: hypothetical protein ACR2I2_08245 [Bryobacteraceae bacterium]
MGTLPIGGKISRESQGEAMELQQFQSSRRVGAKYMKALVKLSEQLNETWKRVLPPEARFPRETCEGFFEPFAQFGVALYDAYAEELLDSNPSQEQYLQALNFDLKTLVCNRIYPYQENPIRTVQDARDADARGELPDEWTVRMGEAWRLFEHPRHSATYERVSREFIDVYGYMPELWGRLIDRIHNAISRRTIHWLSVHVERAAALETGEASQGTIIAKLPEQSLVRMEAETAVSETNGGGADRRAAVDSFILRCKQETTLKATRKHIWSAAGHKSPRQFQFWQASDPKATAQDDQNFRRITTMSPTDFEALLKKKRII